MKSLCRALLILNVLYCLLAAVQEGVPGWHMFEAVEPIDHELRDRVGNLVDVRASLPRGANLVDRGELRRVVEFICRKEHARAPFTYVEPSLGVSARLDPTAGVQGCKVHAVR